VGHWHTADKGETYLHKKVYTGFPVPNGCSACILSVINVIPPASMFQNYGPATNAFAGPLQLFFK